MLDINGAYKYAKRNERRYALEIRIEFAAFRGKILPPGLEITNDKQQYFDPARNVIHLGISGIVEMFNVETEEELENAIQYVLGHEKQHRRSTASGPYAHAIKRGVMTVVEYISSVEEKKPKTFRTDRDVDDYINIDLRDKGIVLNMGMIREMIRHIANSLEDGRIERIRSSIYPGFSVLRKRFRGKFWATMDIDYKRYADMNAGEKLSILVDQVLSLATCQLYTRGFAKAYVGTPLVKETNDTMPYIARSVMSGNARGLEPEVIGISKMLAPYIYEAFRLSATDMAVMEAIQKMLSDMLKSIIDGSLENIPLDERDEETDDGGVDSLFDHSDLVITLKDEDYDKLKEKMKNSDSSSDGGIMIRREHPEQPEKSKDGSGSGKGGDEEQTELKEGESDAKGSNPSESSGSSGKGSGSSEESGNSSGTADGGESGNQSSADEDAGDGNSDTHSGERSNGDSSSTHAGNSLRSEKNREWASDKGNASAPGTSEKGTEEDAAAAVESVLKAIEEAKEISKESARDTMIHDRAVKATSHKEERTRIVEDTAPELTNDDVADVLKGTGFTFREVKRTYPVDKDMPPEISARGKTLHKKMSDFFRAMKTDTIRNRPSGRLESSRLFGITMGEVNIFSRKSEGKGFDGCAYILIDNSGSMYGEKFTEACAAAAIIEEGFRGLFPIKIVSFNDARNVVVHQVIKGWDEALAKNCSWNYHEHSSPNNGNADGCSIAVATKELLSRAESKKLLCVLSDGAPTEGSSDPVALTKQSINFARKKGIQVSGIYFDVGTLGYDARLFKEIYRKDYACISLGDKRLDVELTKLFDKFSRT